MAPINRNSISLYEDAKATFISLLQQTVQVGAGFIVMLLLTGGNPPGFIMGLSFCLGVGFVAWSENKRLEVLDDTILLNKTIITSSSEFTLNEFLPDNINANKRAILKTKINLITYPIKLTVIQNLIQKVLSAETNNFRELAQAVDLDIEKDFAESNLEGCTLPVRRSRYPDIEKDFAESNLEGANLGSANLEVAYLRIADLWRTNLESANLREDNLESANLREANLEGANLGVADFGVADLRGVNLRIADLAGADLRGANLAGANLRSADLRSANLRIADLAGANLGGADLAGANLRIANLRGADLRGADLRGADLRGADLRGADLIGANLIGANLRGANLIGANVENAQFGYNKGLSDKMLEDLIERGAIFIDLQDSPVKVK